MTVVEELCKNFELYLFELRHSRMYPPEYRKEPPMIKLTMEHVNAVCHAELLMDACQLVQGAHKLRAKIEQDLLKLAELKLHIIQQLAGPPELFDKKKDP